MWHLDFRFFDNQLCNFVYFWIKIFWYLNFALYLVWNQVKNLLTFLWLILFGLNYFAQLKLAKHLIIQNYASNYDTVSVQKYFKGASEWNKWMPQNSTFGFQNKLSRVRSNETRYQVLKIDIWKRVISSLILKISCWIYQDWILLNFIFDVI